jgi:hypothetical protein
MNKMDGKAEGRKSPADQGLKGSIFAVSAQVPAHEKTLSGHK